VVPSWISNNSSPCLFNREIQGEVEGMLLSVVTPPCRQQSQQSHFSSGGTRVQLVTSLANEYRPNFYCSALHVDGGRLNSLTPKSVLLGTKNSFPEDFLLAKHTSHKHPHHDEPFSPLESWFPWMNIPHPREPLWKGLDKAAIKGFSIKL